MWNQRFNDSKLIRISWLCDLWECFVTDSLMISIYKISEVVYVTLAGDSDMTSEYSFDMTSY